MLPEISVTCGVMDRQAHLDLALSSWLACPEVDEVLLVDWSSCRPVALPADPRVKLARVVGQQNWCASRCHNLELLLASGRKILRLDADDVLEPGFFAGHALAGGDFFYYDVGQRRDENEKHLAGVVYAGREAFALAGGYNEHISTYGYEDEDLVTRMLLQGLRPRHLDTSLLRHLPHGDDERLARQVVPFDLGARPPWAPWNWQPGASAVDVLADRNAHLALERPWTRSCARATWFLRKISDRAIECEEQR